VTFDALKDVSNALRRAAVCDDHPPLKISDSPSEAAFWFEQVELCPDGARLAHLRWLALNDLYFLLVYLLNRRHLAGLSHNQRNWEERYKERIRNWCFARCREVQDDPDNHIDLWPRESFKSEIITFGKTIQDILRDPNETFGIFSHTRPMAKQFLRQIKQELTVNEQLKRIFPDVLWNKPEREALKWSEDDGIILKRDSNRKEATIEAWGLVDGQPTSKRFTKLLYDDVVSRDKVSVEMIAKTTSEFENSLLLTASDPIQFRYIATYQEIGDTTEQIVNRGIGKLRQRGPFDANGDIAYVSDEKFQDLREKLSPKVFALQILLDTHKAQSEQAAGFDVDWLRYYRDDPPISSMNIYIVVDPAGKAKESNSRFALWVVGLLAPHAMYILDGVLDKFDLGSRADIVIEKHRKWNPLKVGYETYGMQADIEYLRERMMIQHYPFAIVPLGGTHSSKDERIELLIPEFRATNVWLPQKGIFYKDQEGREFDLVKEFVEKEYKLFPFRSNQKDLLDALARMVDPKFRVVWPRPYGGTDMRTGDPWSPNGSDDSGSWMAN